MESTVLIAAKQEYTEQLNDILSENLLTIMKDIWNSCKSSVHPLRSFQEKLCEIPEWNRQVLLRHFTAILEKEDITAEYLEKIIEAVFLSNIKILSVIKLENKKQTVNIKIPDTQNFIHKCIINLARELYQDPHLVDDRETNANLKFEIQRNSKRLLKISKECIERTIRNMIPMKDILDKYLESHDDRSLSSNDNIELEDIEPPASPDIVPVHRVSPVIVPVQPMEQVHEVPDEVVHEVHEVHEVPQGGGNVDDIFMTQPTEQPIKVDIKSSDVQQDQSFFSDDEN